MLVIHAGPVVLVAEDAFKGRKAGGVDVAIRAVVPLLSVSARVDREVLRVMIPIGRRPRSGGMACLAGRRETGSQMVRGRCIVIAAMTSEAL